MSECDWEIHAISDNCECCEGTHTGRPTVYHTHGLAQYNNGYELELNIGINFKQGCQIINSIGFALKDGSVTLTDGCKEESLFSMPLWYVVVNSIDHEEPIMRIVLPDPSGKYPEDLGCEAQYAAQLLPTERIC